MEEDGSSDTEMTVVQGNFITDTGDVRECRTTGKRKNVSGTHLSGHGTVHTLNTEN